MRSVRIGIVGLRVGDGWGQGAHLPALRALPEYRVEAVANASLASSRSSAEAFGIAKAYADAASLARDPEIDMVAVTVKVPHHRELVEAVLAAGKMVQCEWPLGNGLAEAEAMAAMARQAGVRTLVGLQARSSPVIRHLRDLLRDGYVGEVLSTTLVGSGGLWGPQVSARNAYTYDDANGANLLTIPFGHCIDALCHTLGEFAEVSATTARRRSHYTVADTGETHPMRTDDQIAVTGRLRSGAVVATHYRGGTARGTNLRWEINGSEGDLEITAASGHVTMAPLTLRGARGGDRVLETLAIPDRDRLTPPELTGSAVNVAEAYRQFALGDRASHPVPDFADAVVRHRLLDAIRRSADTGARVRL